MWLHGVASRIGCDDAGKLMRRSIPALLSICLALTGCAASNEVAPGQGASVARHQAVVIVGINRAPVLRPYPFVIDIRGVEPGGERITTAKLNPDAPRRADVASIPQGFGASSERFQAFALEPGTYAIASIHPGPQAPPTVYMPISGSGGGAGGGLLALGLVAAIGIATAVGNATSDAPPPPKPETLYVEEDRLLDTAPRFELRPGEVVYLGDMLFGTETRVFERVVKIGGNRPGMAGSGDNETPERVQDNRLFVEYGHDPGRAHSYAVTAGFGDRPFRSVSLQLFAPDRPYGLIASYKPLEAVKDTLVQGPTINRADGSTTAAPPPSRPTVSNPSPVVRPADPSAAKAELMERFLSGAISREQFERERDRLAGGS